MSKETNGFMDTLEKSSDNIVDMFYNESLVKSIESQDFIESLVKSSFIWKLQDFWKGWFKQVFVFFGYLSVIFGIISLLMNLVSMFGYMMYIMGILYVVLWIGMSILSVIVWVWMIKFKKRYPFMVLFCFAYQMIYYIIFSSYWTMVYYPWGSPVWYVVVWIFFFIVFYALVLKNKDLFVTESLNAPKS